METITIEQVRIMLERSGLKLSDRRLESLRTAFEEYRPYLELLHSINVEGEETASVFHPESESRHSLEIPLIAEVRDSVVATKSNEWHLRMVQLSSKAARDLQESANKNRSRIEDEGYWAIASLR